MVVEVDHDLRQHVEGGSKALQGVAWLHHAHHTGDGRQPQTLSHRRLAGSPQRWVGPADLVHADVELAGDEVEVVALLDHVLDGLVGDGGRGGEVDGLDDGGLPAQVDGSYLTAFVDGHAGRVRRTEPEHGRKVALDRCVASETDAQDQDKHMRHVTMRTRGYRRTTPRCDHP